jgi:hypothetical protein
VLAVSAGFDNGAAGDGYNTDAVVGRAAQRWLLMWQGRVRVAGWNPFLESPADSICCFEA